MGDSYNSVNNKKLKLYVYIRFIYCAQTSFLFHVDLQAPQYPQSHLETFILTLDESKILFIVQSFLITLKDAELPRLFENFWNPHFNLLIPFPMPDAFPIDVINC